MTLTEFENLPLSRIAYYVQRMDYQQELENGEKKAAEAKLEALNEKHK